MTKLKLPKLRTAEVPCSLWRRLLAFIIDLFIIDFIIISPFRGYLQNIIPATDYTSAVKFITSNTPAMSSLIIISIFFTIMTLAYFTILEYKIQQTIGKMLFRIKLKPEKKNIRFWNYLLSNITLIPFFPFVILWLIDPIYLLFFNQRFMEKISKIKLVQEVVL